MKLICLIAFTLIASNAYLVDAQPRGLFGSLINSFNTAVTQELQKMINSFITTQAGVDTTQYLEMYMSLKPFIQQLEDNLQKAKTTTEAAQIINNFFYNFDPTFDINKKIIDYFQTNSPIIYSILKYSRTLEQTLNILVPFLKTIYGTNSNLNDPNLYVEIIKQILNSDLISQLNAIINQSTTLPFKIPDIPLPNMNYSMFMNSTVMIHIQEYIPMIILSVLKARSEAELKAIVDNVITAHITPAMIDEIKNYIKQVDPSTYMLIQNIQNVTILYPILAYYLEPFVLDSIKAYLANMGINIPDLKQIFSEPLPVNSTSDAIYQIIFKLLTMNETAEFGFMVESTIKQYMTPELISRLKMVIVIAEPSLYEIIKDDTDVTTLYPKLLPYLKSMIMDGINSLESQYNLKIPDYLMNYILNILNNPSTIAPITTPYTTFTTATQPPPLTTATQPPPLTTATQPPPLTTATQPPPLTTATQPPPPTTIITATATAYTSATKPLTTATLPPPPPTTVITATATAYTSATKPLTTATPPPTTITTATTQPTPPPTTTSTTPTTTFDLIAAANRFTTTKTTIATSKKRPFVI